MEYRLMHIKNRFNKKEGQMSEFQISYPLAGSKYNEMILLNKYGDNFSIMAGETGKDGNVYPQWCYPQVKGKKPGEKSIPIKVNLGNLTDAISLIGAIHSELIAYQKGMNKVREDVPSTMNGKPVDDKSIPF